MVWEDPVVWKGPYLRCTPPTKPLNIDNNIAPTHPFAAPLPVAAQGTAEAQAAARAHALKSAAAVEELRECVDAAASALEVPHPAGGSFQVCVVCPASSCAEWPAG